MAELTHPRDRPRAVRRRRALGVRALVVLRHGARERLRRRALRRGGGGRPPLGASLGCGVPTAVADLHEGETVLDLGSGAGADVLISARRVGETGTRDRARHDRRDARARAGQRERGGRGERRVPRGLPGGHPARGRIGGRGDLQLRDQPRRRQARRARRGRARAAAGRAVRGLRRDRGRGHGRGDARGHAGVERVASRARSPRSSSATRSPPPAWSTSRSARRTGCTRRRPRRSSAPASRRRRWRRCCSSARPTAAAAS